MKKIIICTIVVAIIAYYYLAYTEIDTELLKAAVSGKNVLVTGASSGIGEQVAYEYAKLGANVFVTARREERLIKVISRCKYLAPGRTFGYTVADMNNASDAKMVVPKAIEHIGELDILVINHGFQRFGLWNGGKDNFQTLDEMMMVNFQSHVVLASAALPSLMKNNGSIAVVSSPSGGIPFPAMTPYASSKHALNGFFRTLRSELLYQNIDISITIFVPGAVESELHIKEFPKLCVIFNIPDLEECTTRIFNSIAQPNAAAKELVMTTALRRDDVWWPADQYWWYIKLLHHLKPSLVEKI